jgi:hypothetical protein
VPEIHGREPAGVSHMSSGQARPATAADTPNQAVARTAAARPRGAIHSQAATIPGTTSSAAPILASKPSPTPAPAQIIQRARPSWSPRTRDHRAKTTHSTSSASGLLWREIATAIGVSASVAPAAKPPARPQQRRTMS